MSTASWLRRPAALIAATICLYSATVWTQTQASPPAAAPTPHERLEAAHEDLARSADDRGRAAARLTNAVAAPADPTTLGRAVPRRNFIDDIVFARIAADRVPHAALSSDDEFVRRIYLDVVGLPPSAAAVRAFVADPATDKRDRLIDTLLSSDEFAEQWAWYWGDLLRMSNEAGPGANAFHFWFKEQLKVDRPYDQFVHDVLTPSSKVHATIPSLAIIGRSNQLKSRFVESVDDYRISNRLDHVDALAIDVTRVFLGLNTSCISCHDGALHLESVNGYLADRTRDEFFAMAAFFGKTRLIGNWNDKSRNVDRDLHVDDLAGGYNGGNDAPFLTLAESQFPRPAGSHEPSFILTGEKPRAGAEPRAELARMIAAHPQFARATVNLLWGRLMAVAFVEPHDAFDLNRLSGKHAQPTNVALLEALAGEFTKNGFRLKRTIRTILQSSTYQLSSRFPGQWKDDYIPYYSRHFARVLTGPEVIDAVATVTGVPMQFQMGGETMQRVKQLATPQDIGRGAEGMSVDALMQSFFQSNRRTPPQTGNRPSTLQALLMMKSTVVNDRVAVAAKGRVAELVESPRTTDQVIDELYLSTMARAPSASELAVARRTLGKDRAHGTEDLLWALLNSPEFLVNR
jgi:Protein of unknown function (DUF1549)/Protein of unknown function (DUF1553)